MNNIPEKYQKIYAQAQELDSKRENKDGDILNPRREVTRIVKNIIRLEDELEKAKSSLKKYGIDISEANS